MFTIQFDFKNDLHSALGFATLLTISQQGQRAEVRIQQRVAAMSNARRNRFVKLLPNTIDMDPERLHDTGGVGYCVRLIFLGITLTDAERQHLPTCVATSFA